MFKRGDWFFSKFLKTSGQKTCEGGKPCKGCCHLGWVVSPFSSTFPSSPGGVEPRRDECVRQETVPPPLVQQSITPWTLPCAPLKDSPVTLCWGFVRSVLCAGLHTPGGWDPRSWLPISQAVVLVSLAFRTFRNRCCVILNSKNMSVKYTLSRSPLAHSPVHLVATWWHSGKCWSTLRIWGGAM